MSVLVDTNVLLCRLQPHHEHHALAIDSVARLLISGEQVYLTFNTGDFARFEIEALHPSAVASAP